MENEEKKKDSVLASRVIKKRKAGNGYINDVNLKV